MRSDGEDSENRDSTAPSRSPTQSNLHSYSPTNGAPPRTQYINPYHPPSPSPLPMPAPASHITGSQASPYHSEYQPVPRDKPTSGYYDPTSDSIERRPSGSAAWSEGQNTTSQVRAYKNTASHGALCQFNSNVIFRHENHICIHRRLLSNPVTTTAHIPRRQQQVSLLDHR